MSDLQERKFDYIGEDSEDYISVGTIGLIKTIESFAPNKGTKLAAFAAECIKNGLLMCLRFLCFVEVSSCFPLKRKSKAKKRSPQILSLWGPVVGLFRI